MPVARAAWWVLRRFSAVVIRAPLCERGRARKIVLVVDPAGPAVVSGPRLEPAATEAWLGRECATAGCVAARRRCCSTTFSAAADGPSTRGGAAGVRSRGGVGTAAAGVEAVVGTEERGGEAGPGTEAGMAVAAEGRIVSAIAAAGAPTSPTAKAMPCPASDASSLPRVFCVSESMAPGWHVAHVLRLRSISRSRRTSCSYAAASSSACAASSSAAVAAASAAYWRSSADIRTGNATQKLVAFRIKNTESNYLFQREPRQGLT